MKTLATLSLLLSALASFSAHAEAIDTVDKARALKNQLSPLVMSMKGVNGIGVSGCNPSSGERFIDGKFVHCVVINTENRKAADALEDLLPLGSRVGGTFVVIDYIGPIGIQPRISVGN
jgi:hypothetical protein